MTPRPLAPPSPASPALVATSPGLESAMPLFNPVLASARQHVRRVRRAQPNAAPRRQPMTEAPSAAEARAGRRQGWCWLALGAVVSAALFGVARALTYVPSKRVAAVVAIVAGLAGLHAWAQCRAGGWKAAAGEREVDRG